MKNRARKPWMFWLLLIVLCMAGEWVRDEFVPPGHWSERLLVETLPMLGATVILTLYLRWRGLSLEARFDLFWINVRRLMLQPPPVEALDIYFPKSIKWLGTSVGVALMTAVLWLELSVRSGEVAPIIIIAVIGLATVGFRLLLSRPIVSMGPSGLGELGARPVPWERIATCRVHAKRWAWGQVNPPRVIVRGRDGRRIMTLDLTYVPRHKRRHFLLALHRALLATEEMPDIAQVLGDAL